MSESTPRVFMDIQVYGKVYKSSMPERSIYSAEKALRTLITPTAMRDFQQISFPLRDGALLMLGVKALENAAFVFYPPAPPEEKT